MHDDIALVQHKARKLKGSKTHGRKIPPVADKVAQGNVTSSEKVQSYLQKSVNENGQFVLKKQNIDMNLA